MIAHVYLSFTLGTCSDVFVFWPHSVFGQNHLYVRMLQTGIPLFRVKFSRISKFPVSLPDAHLSTVPSVRTTCLSVRTSDRQASSVRTTCFFHPGTYIVSRSFCTSLLRPDVSAARPDAYQFSNSSLILSKFQEREDQSTVQTMWYPVRTRISVRQESQF
jgi:hypothetical protein